MKSYVKILGPPVGSALKALEKVASETKQIYVELVVTKLLNQERKLEVTTSISSGVKIQAPNN